MSGDHNCHGRYRVSRVSRFIESHSLSVMDSSVTDFLVWQDRTRNVRTIANVVAKPRRAMVLTFGEFIGIFDSAEGNLATTFDPAHSPHQSAEYVFLLPFDWQFRVECCPLTHLGNVCFGVVLVGWCPPGDDCANGVDGRALVKIVVDDDEASAQAIL